MKHSIDAGGLSGGGFEILAPAMPTLPLVLASPHSGKVYPQSFLAASRLGSHDLRRSEDCYVDEIFQAAPALGAPLIRALFPRAFLDANREAFELDPAMFADPLPAYVNSRSPRVAAGLGTIPRLVGDGGEIYRDKLRFAEAADRIDRFHRPYHAALTRLIEDTAQRFGHCLLLDCHSMPSGPRVSTPAAGLGTLADFVLGDCFGAACAGTAVDAAERVLCGFGYSVRRNAPYAGGFTTRHYGRPRQGRHALQIEITRALYMDETSLAKKPHLTVLRDQMAALIAVLGQLTLPASGEP